VLPLAANAVIVEACQKQMLWVFPIAAALDADMLKPSTTAAAAPHDARTLNVFPTAAAPSDAQML